MMSDHIPFDSSGVKMPSPWRTLMFRLPDAMISRLAADVSSHTWFQASDMARSTPATTAGWDSESFRMWSATGPGFDTLKSHPVIPTTVTTPPRAIHARARRPQPFGPVLVLRFVLMLPPFVSALVDVAPFLAGPIRGRSGGLP